LRQGPITPDKGLFLDPAEPLDAMLEALRCGPVADGLLEHEFEGRPPAQVFCAA
jgi:hypothetical protein